MRGMKGEGFQKHRATDEGAACYWSPRGPHDPHITIYRGERQEREAQLITHLALRMLGLARVEDLPDYGVPF